MRRLFTLLVVAALCSGCGVMKRKMTLGPSVDKDLQNLESQLDVLPPFPMPAKASGSLWTDAGPGAAMNRDTRAYRVNDLVTISVQESSTGTNAANTALDRSSNLGVGAQTGQINISSLITGSTNNTFDGDGTTSRSNTLTGFVTARVMQVLPNGDLILAGQKTVMINHERQMMTLVGSIRPVDIDAQNQVSSALVGNLTVRLWGRGEIDSSVRQGWFSRMLNRIWPF